MSQVTRKMVAFFMVIALLAVSISCGCGGAWADDLSADFSLKAKQSSSCSKATDTGSHCPGSPDHEDSDSGDCDSCSCSCHASLLTEPIRLIISAVVTPLVFHEPFTYLPQVYLSKFIPPQNAA
jgi:hypothetical protein